MKEWVLNGLKDISISLINGSYSICLVICMLAIILYIAGLKKARKYATISLVVYILLQSCKGLLK